MKTVFGVVLVLFIGIGLLMVGGQAIGLLTQNSELVIRSVEVLEVPAYIFSSIAAILGFVFIYTKEKVS
ncbi:hypothetical protein DVB69_06400 [Sporosarcina sp. BI001-red]|uniref:hypothetical protein n=1 Tax=Sporosarcina sp. BI001-red TaxID=2282866 RepID=UPI000E2351A3|nr:hypothetical protein [Sporosarcina sp. BI001-red]REB08751.1 hypothetical protein DVB69_06400 [Sporosarcina sp. BI001-red]